MTSGKILILGGSGYVGQGLFRHLGPERSVATYSSTPFPGGIKFDALTMRLSDLDVDLGAFSHAIILFGDTHPDSCVNDIEKSQALNVIAIQKLIDDIADKGIFPLFASSQFVFDGVRGSYIETDPVSPMLKYGEQKIQIENYLAARLDEYAIMRLAKVYGSMPGDPSLFVQWHKTASQGGATFKCASDYIASPIHIDDLSEAIVRMVELGCRGLYHLAGPEPLSRMDMFKILLEEMRKVEPVEVNLIDCSIDDFQTPEGRPHDVSMLPDKIVTDTGVTLRDVRSSCRDIVEAMHQND